MNTQFKVLRSKASVYALAISLLAAFSFSPADAAFASADPEMTTPPVFSVSGNTLTLSQNSAWTDGSVRTMVAGSFLQQAYACPGPLATSGTGNVLVGYPEQILNMHSCVRLATDQNGATPFASGDLTDIYFDNSPAFATLASQPTRFNHITVVSSVVSAGFIRFAYEPTVPFTYTPVAPTLVTPPTSSLSGSVLTFSMGSWSNGTPSALVRACTSAKTAITTPQSSFLSDCILLYESANPGPLSGAPIDLSTAYVVRAGSSERYSDFLASAGNSQYVHVIALSNPGFNNGPYYVYSASVEFLPSGSSPAQAVPTATPYTGPILKTPGAVAPVAQGSKVVIPGSNLSGVSKVEIGGMDAKVVVNSAGELEITVPVGLAAGTYDLIVTSDSGRLTVQDGIRVSGSAAVSETNESTATPSTKLKEDNTVKVHVFDVVGAGKVQIMFNGKEIAWVNTTDPNDSKLLNEYLVRTLELVDGKNVIEIFVDGKRVDRKAYTK